MLSYQHAYHAGNAADCHKHAVLSILLTAFLQKETPFGVLDTHSGRGLYPLDAPEMQKIAEYRDGIGRLWDIQDWPPALQAYRRILLDLNPSGALLYYPGSPMVTRAFLRASDHGVFCELHPGEITYLHQTLGTDPRCTVHAADGWQALATALPLPEKRGLVLIDPSYEIKSDYADMIPRLQHALKKWRNGVYAIWYPILPDNRHRIMLDGFEVSGIRKVFVSEMRFTNDPHARGMTGTGMMIINPPWQSDETITTVTQWLTEKLGVSCRNDWLVPE